MSLLKSVPRETKTETRRRLIAAFYPAFRTYLRTLYPEARSKRRLAIEASSRTGVSLVTVLKIYEGGSMPYGTTMQKLLAIAPSPNADPVRCEKARAEARAIFTLLLACGTRTISRMLRTTGGTAETEEEPFAPQDEIK